MLSATASSSNAIWSQEPPPRSPERGRMPTWQREILERKRAKTAGSPCSELSPGRKRSEYAVYRSFASGKPQPRSPARKPMNNSGEGSAGTEQESLVLQESLGPLHQNPFIRLEKERKRRLQQLQTSSESQSGNNCTPIQHLLDLYSNVPGIRTIRAENIIIIESDPDYFSEHSRSTSPKAVDSATDSLAALLARRSNKVTEISASEVVVYEPSLSQSQEEISTHSMGQFNGLLDDGMGHSGRVSRLLEKFDQNYIRPQRSRSSDSLLDQDCNYKPHMLPKSPLSSPAVEWQSHSSIYKLSSKSEVTSGFAFNGPIPWIPSKHSSLSVLSSPSEPTSRKLTLSSPQSPSAYLGSFSHSLSSQSEKSTTMEDKSGSLDVPSREKFENFSLPLNQIQSKLKNVSQKTGNSTITVYPKGFNNLNSKDSVIESFPAKKDLLLTNGHVVHSELDLMSAESIIIQEILAGNTEERERLTRNASEQNRLVPSTVSSSTDELLKGGETWRTKSEVDLIRLKFCATPATSPYETSGLSHSTEKLTSFTPSQQKQVSAAISSNDSFQIQPAPKPDLANIPADDVQAMTLANIRMQSKNTFTFIPKRRPESPSYQVEDGNMEKPNDKYGASNFSYCQMQFRYLDGEHGGQDRKEDSISEEASLHPTDVDAEIMESTDDSMVPLPKVDQRQELLPPCASVTERYSLTGLGAELEFLGNVKEEEHEKTSRVPITNIRNREFSSLDVPVTNIDDMIHAEGKGTNPSSFSFQPHVGLSSFHFKKGNTFTVVPKHKLFAPDDEGFGASDRERDAGCEVDSRLKTESVEGSELGVSNKKRYPTVNEIEVIGGYMLLQKSCLYKHDSTRKKLKISFNENSLQTMFEYPSESSLVEEEEEEEDGDKASVSETEEEERSYFLPRPSFINGTTPGMALRQNPSNSDFFIIQIDDLISLFDSSYKVYPATLPNTQSLVAGRSRSVKRDYPLLMPFTRRACFS
ncbi:taperin isoform X2 [Microcaecilia unicolor]|uniref:Taperin isoform X2 n=1 Tax=Microcaecilia unicolor TaxID=1415580 RepID=A0A6P7YAL1_9AMPH|nr:taperin isoform X2 [Microcaecilia unicolor]